MRARRVLNRTLLGHNVQVGFQIRATGPGRQPSKLRWKIAYLVDEHAPVTQCWSDLVDWVFRSGRREQPLRDLRLSDLLPWRPLSQHCRDSAAECGACYCGGVARADVAALRDGPRARAVVPMPEAAR